MNNISTKLFIIFLYINIVGCNFSSNTDELISKAKQQAQHKDYNGAINTLMDAKAKEPKNPFVHLELGKILIATGKSLKAEKSLKKARALNIAIEQWIIPLAQSYLIQKKYQELIDDINTDGVTSPDIQALIYTFRGKAEMGLNHYDQALVNYEQALSLLPKNKIALLGKFEALKKQNVDTDTLKAYELFLKKDPTNTDLLLSRAVFYASKNETKKAQADFDQILKIEPKNIQAMIGKLNHALASNDQETLKKYINQLKTYKAPPATIKYYTAVAAYAAHKLTEAEKILLELKDKHNAESILLLAKIQAQLSKYQDAKQTLTPLYRVAHKYLPVSKLYASILMKLADYDGVVNVIEKLPQSQLDKTLLMLGASAYQKINLNKKADELIALVPERMNNNNIKPSNAITPTQMYQLYKLIENHKYVEALQLIQPLKKKKSQLAEAYYLEGQVYTSQNKLDKAKDVLNKSLKENPNYLPALSKMAVISEKEGHLERAKMFYNRIIKISPKNTLNIVRLAQIASKQGNGKGAIQILLDAEKTHKNDYLILLTLANISLYQKKIEEAIKWFNQMSEIDQNKEKSQLVHAAILFSQGKYKAADKIYQNLSHNMPLNADTKYKHALIQIKLAKIDEARKSLIEAISLEPKNEKQYRTILAELALKENNIGRILKNAHKLQKKYPNYLYAYYLASRAYKEQDDYDNAAKELETALKLNNTNEKLTSELALIYHQQHKTDKAIKQLKQYLVKKPNSSIIYFSLGLIYQQSNQLKSALKAYQKSLKLSPKNIIALNNMAWLLIDQTKYKQAVSAAKKAYELSPKSAAITDTYGWALFKNKQIKKGAELLAKAHQQNMDNTEISTHFAEILVAQKKIDQAKTLLNEVLKQDPKYQPAKNLLDKIK